MKTLITLPALAALALAAACSGSPVTTTTSQFNRANLNADDGLNISEYHALIEIQAADGLPTAKALSKENPVTAEKKIQERFDYLDTNHTGKLSREELGVATR